MIDIGQSLLRAQRSRTIKAKHLLLRCVLTYPNATTQTYTKTKIKQLTHTRQAFSHKAQVMIEDTDKTLHGLDLEGYKAVISAGLITRAGEEWVALPPLWVAGQDRDSYRDRLECLLELEGIFDRMGKHKATASYTPDSTDTRTVKDWLREIIELVDPDTETTVEQTTVNADMTLHDDVRLYAGQKKTISDKRLTKLAFWMKKVGDPTGPIALSIKDTATDQFIARKVWGDAFNLGTSYDWVEVTFDTPVYINEEVRFFAEWDGGEAGGQALDYVAVGYDSTGDVADENMVWIYTGDWQDEATYDCAYQYKYSATPVTPYDEYPAYGLVFDSEDDLIDAFIPADSFRIGLNDTRLQKVKELLRYTDCVAVPKNDELIHIFVPTTSGTTYDNEFSLVQGRDYHNFFSKRFRRRIVSPNYITFMNHPAHADSYTGYAKDDSADLTDMKEIETHYVRPTSHAQCTNLATAYLSKLQMAAEKGSAVLPFVHFGQEIYDYVNFVDARAGDNRAGNVGFLTIYYKPGQFNMHIGFGRVSLGVAALMGLAAEAGGEWRLTAENLLPIIESMDSYIRQILDILENDVIFIDDYSQDKLNEYEDAYFRKLTVTQQLNIPSEAA